MRSRTELMFQVAIEIRMGESVPILRATAIRGRGAGLLQYPLVIDREQARVGPPATVKIVARARGVVALRLGDRPLPQPEVLPAEPQHQHVGPADPVQT